MTDLRGDMDVQDDFRRATATGDPEDGSGAEPIPRRRWTLAEDAPTEFLGPLLIVGHW